ncbi:MAG: hypothetical protein VB877_07880 [Pirellulaceae bacterium]
MTRLYLLGLVFLLACPPGCSLPFTMAPLRSWMDKKIKAAGEQVTWVAKRRVKQLTTIRGQVFRD